MSAVTLSMQMSLDGRTAGPQGEFDWPIVGDELLGSFTEEAREAAAFDYGRRMYTEMAGFWPTGDTAPGATPSMAEYARPRTDRLPHFPGGVAHLRYRAAR